MKIGIFDSGYGGLTILEKIRERLPQYDYIYLGDNARTPYGTRSFEVVYDYTWQCVKKLFEMDCQLVILACNTASAKALRSIQQNELLKYYPNRRVLGVIRPTAESINTLTKSRVVGLVATDGTVQSNSYVLEIGKLANDIKLYSQACPMWVPLIENNEHTDIGADFFVKKYLDELMAKNSAIDTLILGCTHYPLLLDKITQNLPSKIQVLTQGAIVAESLVDYLKRHPEQETQCSKEATTRFLTTESVEKFQSSASIFLKEKIEAERVSLD
ncbi:MAG TPA: glutamate racemase [Paludibacteraceae bacterium]|nr:glutamate racemase [Paludibacteraceae bacterium]